MPKFKENDIIEIEGEVVKVKQSLYCSGCVFNKVGNNCPKNKERNLICSSERPFVVFTKPTKKEITEYLQSKPILMGTDNPTGWKLEELLEKIMVEIEGKTKSIIDSTHVQRDMILTNNSSILDALQKAKIIQIETYRKLDAVEPNHGPSNPRL